MYQNSRVHNEYGCTKNFYKRIKWEKYKKTWQYPHSSNNGTRASTWPEKAGWNNICVLGSHYSDWHVYGKSGTGGLRNMHTLFNLPTPKGVADSLLRRRAEQRVHQTHHVRYWSVQQSAGYAEVYAHGVLQWRAHHCTPHIRNMMSVFP